MIRKMALKAALISLTLVVSNVKAQTKTELILRSNLGVGTEYKSLEYSNFNSSGKLLYSPGGGMGIEIGLGYFPIKSIEIYSTLGYQKNLAIQYYSSTSGGTDKTSFTFGRRSILLGTNYNFKFSENSPLGLKIGGGGSYNIPGKMSITELNFNYGDVTFYPEFGFHFEIGLFYELDKWIIFPSIRYRNINFHFKKYDQSIYSSSTGTDNYGQFIEYYIKNVNTSGIDLSITFRRKLFNN